MLKIEKDWAQSAVFYQIYPMGFCGAPFHNDGVTVNRIAKVKEWIPHLEKLGISAVYFSPVFESDSHGYDTRDYRKIDCRLGTATLFIRRGSVWYWMACSTTWVGVSGLSGTCRRNGRPLPTKIGSTSISEETAATTTASGTRAGKATTNW